MEMPFKTGFQVVSPFGYRTDPITGQAGSWHGGVDLVGNDRSVSAVADSPKVYIPAPMHSPMPDVAPMIIACFSILR